MLDTVVDLTDQTPQHDPPNRNGAAADAYTRVALLVNNGVPTGEAISRVARETGKARHTIQNHFYRHRRKLRAETPPTAVPPRASRPARPSAAKTERVPARAAGSANRRLDGDAIDAIAEQLLTATSALSEAASAQATQMAELRARLDAIRRLIG